MSVKVADFSSTNTARPARAITAASDEPAIPPPTMIMS
jgi:hypothetical protein